jgi:hypothetical protein
LQLSAAAAVAAVTKEGAAIKMAAAMTVVNFIMKKGIEVGSRSRFSFW